MCLFVTSIKKPTNETGMHATAIYGKLQIEKWILFNMTTDIYL